MAQTLNPNHQQPVNYTARVDPRQQRKNFPNVVVDRKQNGCARVQTRHPDDTWQRLMQEVAKSQGISCAYAIDDDVVINDARKRRGHFFGLRGSYANDVLEKCARSENSTAEVARVVADVPVTAVMVLARAKLAASERTRWLLQARWRCGAASKKAIFPPLCD